jgi:hypothetical protein
MKKLLGVLALALPLTTGMVAAPAHAQEFWNEAETEMWESDNLIQDDYGFYDEDFNWTTEDNNWNTFYGDADSAWNTYDDVGDEGWFDI